MNRGAEVTHVGATTCGAEQWAGLQRGFQCGVMWQGGRRHGSWRRARFIKAWIRFDRPRLPSYTTARFVAVRPPRHHRPATPPSPLVCAATGPSPSARPAGRPGHHRKARGAPPAGPALVPAVGAWAGRGDRPGCQVLGPTAVLGPIAVVWGGRGTRPGRHRPVAFSPAPNLMVQFFFTQFRLGRIG